jgi:hypothetical protein
MCKCGFVVSVELIFSYVDNSKYTFCIDLMDMDILETLKNFLNNNDNVCYIMQTDSAEQTIRYNDDIWTFSTSYDVYDKSNGVDRRYDSTYEIKYNKMKEYLIEMVNEIEKINNDLIKKSK